MNRPADQEMIELKNLGLEKQLDLTRGPRGTSERPVRLERANALRISPGKVPEILSRVRKIRLLGGQSDPKLTEELGEGHVFKPCTQSQPTWCDLCGEFIWGVYKKRLQCIRKYQALAARGGFGSALTAVDSCQPGEIELGGGGGSLTEQSLCQVVSWVENIN